MTERPTAAFAARFTVPAGTGRGFARTPAGFVGFAVGVTGLAGVAAIAAVGADDRTSTTARGGDQTRGAVEEAASPARGARLFACAADVSAAATSAGSRGFSPFSSVSFPAACDFDVQRFTAFDCEIALDASPGAACGGRVGRAFIASSCASDEQELQFAHAVGNDETSLVTGPIGDFAFMCGGVAARRPASGHGTGCACQEARSEEPGKTAEESWASG
jgi:hypothetical protein